MLQFTVLSTVKIIVGSLGNCICVHTILIEHVFQRKKNEFQDCEGCSRGTKEDREEN